MNITLHMTWPIHMDYPLWRAQFKKYRPFVSQALVSLSNNHETMNLTDDIRHTLGELGVPCFDAPERYGDQDWRDAAIKKAYNNINSEWIWFTEQDFFIKDKSFFDKVSDAMKYHEFIAYEDEGRLHPACLFVKKTLSDRISRNFSTIPDVADHFYIYTEELKKGCGKYWTTLQNLGLKDRVDFYHMTGLTHNYHRVREGLGPTRPNDFAVYNQYSLQVEPQILEFQQLSEKIKVTMEQYEDKEHFLVPLFKSILE